jgi:elongation factor G
MQFPQTVIDMAIEPRSSADKDRFEEVLRRLAREDPTFDTRQDRETGQLLISGMGELHLEVLQHRMRDEFSLQVNVGTPRVAYKETLSQAVEIQEKFVRQLGNRGLYAVVHLRLEPKPLGGRVEFDSQLGPDRIQRRHAEALKEGVLNVARGGGGRTGYPVINVRVTLTHAEEHPSDSNELAFESAGMEAFRRGMEEAAAKYGPTLLEPVMAVEVVAPEEYVGELIGDLNSRRALIVGVESRGHLKVIQARAPLAEMFGYATDLRSMTQGRGVHTMSPCDYQRAPQRVHEKFIV